VPGKLGHPGIRSWGSEAHPDRPEMERGPQREQGDDRLPPAALSAVVGRTARRGYTECRDPVLVSHGILRRRFEPLSRNVEVCSRAAQKGNIRFHQSLSGGEEQL